MANSKDVIIISKHTVQPRTNQNSTKLIHLTPFDLKMLSVQYIQKGLLFHKPQNESTPSIISSLLPSFSLALDRYYPFAGRILTTPHDSHDDDDDDDDDDDCISISLCCNHKGAEFTHAIAPHTKVSDIITPNSYYITPIVPSLFPLNGLFGHEGHVEPLLGVQVTELLDGIFIGCSLNHCVGDGNTFWKLINTWSDISRNKGSSQKLGAPLKFDRWFPESVIPPIYLSSKKYSQIKKFEVPYVPECFFQFSSDNIKKLKAKANEEMDTNKISSLQALVAHMWKSVTRARAHVTSDLEEESSCNFMVGFRSKVDPPLPETYVGNSCIQGMVSATTWELQSKSLGFVAWILNQEMSSKDKGSVYEAFKLGSTFPMLMGLEKRRDGCVHLSSSPRFDVYGNDFGWGKPVGARSGPGNKLEGMITLYEGVEGGIDLEIGLPGDVMKALLQDEGFMEYVLVKLSEEKAFSEIL